MLVLGAPLFAAAQAMANAPSSATTPAVVDSGPGLVGTSYAELSFGYDQQKNSPTSQHDYEFLSNEAAYRSGIWGVDANFLYDYLEGSGDGYHDRRDTLEMGGTAFLTQVWGKPFLTGDAGMAWQQAGGVSRKGFVYDFQAGVEFAVLPNLVLSPFVGFEALPHFYNHEALVADFPDHTLDTGVKATYRFTRQWHASLTGTIDQYSSRDLGIRAGVGYHF